MSETTEKGRRVLHVYLPAKDVKLYEEGLRLYKERTGFLPSQGAMMRAALAHYVKWMEKQ